LRQRIYNLRSIKTMSTMMTMTTRVPMPMYMMCLPLLARVGGADVIGFDYPAPPGLTGRARAAASRLPLGSAPDPA
jgi:hypothetical protein